MITLNDIEFSNRKFWTGFVATSFPTNPKLSFGLMEE